MSSNTPTYPSKIDTWLAVVLGFSALVALVACAVLVLAPVPGGWTVALFLALTAVCLPAWLLMTTGYQFQGDELLIRSGPFRWRIPVQQIKAVSNTRNPLSSPALSLDRILIEYGAGKAIMVSPKDQQGFLRDLQARREGG